MFAFVILWILLIIYSMKYVKGSKNDPFNKVNAMALRGICAIEIMLGHLGISTGSVFLYPNRKAGILFVGIFFALSGYGLSYSILNKENYFHSFFNKRIPKIIIPAYIVFLISEIVSGGGKIKCYNAD